jgi:hypothetical protein
MSRVPRGFVFFCLVLALLGGYYLHRNVPLDINSLSSDIWGYQLLELQERYHYWSEVPPSYNQSELYVAFPLFYYLNPGLQHGLLYYHVLALLLIAAIYACNGMVVYVFFKNWYIASFAGALCVIPRYIYPTQIGMFSLSQLRANALLFPLSFAFGYYWVLRGIKEPKKNIGLAVLAGLATYVYPPTAITMVLFSVITAFIIHRKKYFREIGIFCAVFALISSPFLINHFINPDTGILDAGRTLTAQEQAEENAALTRAFGGNASIFAVEFEEMKRIAWDQTPLILLCLVSMYVVWRYRERLGKDAWDISVVSVWLAILTCGFVFSIEALNTLSLHNGGTYVFSEHLRIMRGVGFVLFMQCAVLLYALTILGRRRLAIGIAAFVVCTPIFFFAPALRAGVRAIVPEGVRARYNLAPVVMPTEEKSFTNLVAASLWARNNLPHTDTKIFVFTEYQSEYQFKFLSRQDTTMTEKEGAIWATSGFDNSMSWYKERSEYDAVVAHATRFEDILAFARAIGATHMLLPKGHYTELYEQSPQKLRVLYANEDYRILAL